MTQENPLDKEVIDMDEVAEKELEIEEVPEEVVEPVTPDQQLPLPVEKDV